MEHAIAKHKAVAMVAVIGVPDALRGELIKVYFYLLFLVYVCFY